jgi:hypothetical protein
VRRVAAVLAAALVLALALLAVPSRAAHAASVVLSQGKTTTASSVENVGTPASSATDGDLGTRWSSQAADPQWLAVDLGSAKAVTGVHLAWETAYASAYQIQTSDDGSTWTTRATGTASSSTAQDVAVTATARYVRLYATARATQWGVSLWEFQVLGSDAAPPAGDTIL